MDHDAYEDQMFDVVNRNAEERADAHAEVTPTKEKAFDKRDAQTLWRGIKCLILALITAALYALSVNSILLVSTKVGWWAVVAFLAGIILLIFATTLLYALGLVIGRKGETK